MGSGEARRAPGNAGSTIPLDNAGKADHTRPRNLVLAHWRGQLAPYSRAQGAAIGLAAIALVLAHFLIPYPVAFRPGPQVWLLAAREFFVLVPVYGWLLVGLWRSGASYVRRRATTGESTRYGRELQVGVVLIVLWLIWDVATHFPYLSSLNLYFLFDL